DGSAEHQHIGVVDCRSLHAKGHVGNRPDPRRGNARAGSDERNQERNAMKRMVGIRQMATFRQPVQHTRAACRNRVRMIASPRMAAPLDDRLVIDAIPAQVWRADSSGTMQFVNEVWLDYT